MVLLAFVYVFILFLNSCYGLCGDTIRWVHNMSMGDIYGRWYGVGHAQHSPDMTNDLNQVGCIVLYISDAALPYGNLMMPRNYASDYTSREPWQRLKRKVKRGLYDSKHMRILWDKDGLTMEQIYMLSTEDPGLWLLEQHQHQAIGLGPEYWRPGVPRRPEVIRILRVNPELLVMSHCSEAGDGGGIFSLILRRKPSKMERWPWLYYSNQFYEWGLPKMYRHSAVCSACVGKVTINFVIFCILFQKILPRY